jgi:hypothetical protein
MKFTSILTLVIFFSFFGQSQSNLRIDPMFEMSVEQFDLQKPLALWLNFLNSENDLAASIYWNENEINQYGDSSYFLMMELDYSETGDIVQNLKHGTTIIGISENKGLYKITSKFEFKINDSTFVNPYIFHVYAKSTSPNGELKLYNPLPINKELYMESEKIGNIEYIYPKSHVFNRKKAKKQYKEIKALAKKFDFTLSDYQFIFTNDRESMYRLGGYDFNFQSIGNEQPSGKADVKSRIVYSYGRGEYFPHELIHLFINPAWPRAHSWLIEGFATYYGGSRGETLDWHLKRLTDHLKNHPEVDLDNMLELRNMDVITGYRYVLGGYIIQLAYEKGGIKLVKKIMETGESDLELYTAIEDLLGINRNDLNEYIRKDLK